jgi:homoserine dehydrogenase
MPHHTLALVGFGNVGRALARLLLRKKDELHDKHSITFQVNGIATGRHGTAIDPEGLDIQRALELAAGGHSIVDLNRQPAVDSVMEFIRLVPADILFENSPVNHHTGQPAADYLKAALQHGMHAITANKGPVVHALSDLNALAARHNRRFLYESTVMDGAPIFSLFRGSLPCIELRGFRGILNSCTNMILGMMEEGRSFDDAVAYAQSIGIAETDPSADIDGWDAAIKVAALATVLMGSPLKPQDVDRTGIRGMTQPQIAEARQMGRHWKLVCECARHAEFLEARVAPEQVSPDSPFFSITGTSSYVQFELDVLPGLGIVETNPGPETTAYGLLADMINASRGM